MNFDESVIYLYALGNEVLAMKLGLENIGKLLAAIGNPHHNFLKVQIAGTNGKGSTCAFLDAICRSAHIKTGLYTSPHLISITERIKINGEEISEADFARHAAHIRKVSENLVKTGELEAVPTFFEQITAIALFAFAEAKIELAILETGLGGRFDATTATNAEIIGITQIDYDHQQILGNTLTKIAGEKAAIIRADTKVVISRQNTEAQKVILDKCREVGVIPVSNCHWIQENGNEIFYKTKNNIYAADLSLPGQHQRDNACVAIQLAEILTKDFGFNIGLSEIEKGLQTATHKGRLEFYKGILFDGAHNIAGAKALRKFLNEFVSQPITMIFGAMRDKDLTDIAAVLFPKADKLILTKPDNPRSMETAELMKFVPKSFNSDKIFQVENIEKALNFAREISNDKNLICVTGSLYLVGEVQEYLNAGR